MAHPDAATDVRARTHIGREDPHNPSTSGNVPPRPSLRLVSPADTSRTPTRPDGSGTRGHLGDALAAAATHPVAATHPPTVSAAIGDLWPEPGQVRYGLAGQIGSAAVGLVQVVGLAVCWQVAHVGFATKTRTLISLIIISAVLLLWAAATHA